MSRVHTLRTKSGLFYRLLGMRGVTFDTLATDMKEVELVLDEGDSPSTRKSEPVMKAPWGRIRSSATLATSSAVPGHPAGHLANISLVTDYNLHAEADASGYNHAYLTGSCQYHYIFHFRLSIQ